MYFSQYRPSGIIKLPHFVTKVGLFSPHMMVGQVLGLHSGLKYHQKHFVLISSESTERPLTFALCIFNKNNGKFMAIYTTVTKKLLHNKTGF